MDPQPVSTVRGSWGKLVQGSQLETGETHVPSPSFPKMEVLGGAFHPETQTRGRALLPGLVPALLSSALKRKLRLKAEHLLEVTKLASAAHGFQPRGSSLAGPWQKEVSGEGRP